MSSVAPVAGPASTAVHARSVVVTGILVLVVMSMVLPMPPVLLDIGIAVSIACAILILVMAALVTRPTDFQAFPVLLLVSLVLRLSLNVSSTRLILTEGHTGPEAAGHVISGFSSFVAGGSLLIGLTVFAVISAVNFMVITKGSGRMAEVAARLALDSLPGKQLAIDADLSSGAIDHEEAKLRRAREAAEISFFGSLDGASKFVKGDAVAGIVIIFINLLVGLAVGVLSHGLAVGEALRTYAFLTIGDGLVTQIPALITSMAAALLLSRGGATEPTAELLSGQMLGNWRAPAIVAAGMVVMAMVPGMPKPVFLVLAAIFAGLAWRTATAPAPAPTDAPAEVTPAPQARIGDALDLDEIAVEIGPDLVAPALDEGRGLGPRIANLRLHLARSYGVILPDIRITDAPELAAGEYLIRVHNVIRGRGSLRPHEVLVLGEPATLDAIGGTPVREPVYDAPARWIAREAQAEATLQGGTVVAPMEVLSTHLLEVARRSLPQLMSLGALQRMIAELKELSDPRRAEIHRRFFDGMIPDKVPPELLLAVLRLLLREGISVRNLAQITDCVAEWRGLENPEAIAERVRHRLRGQITEALLTPGGRLEMVQLHPLWEAEFTRAETAAPRGAAPLPSARLAARLAEAVKAALAAAATGRPVLAVPDHRRRAVKAMLDAAGIDVTVIGLDEIEPATPLAVLATAEAG
ncbi:flagellar type III secretion system protein FlhA [Paracoccus sp. S-4012]|uniref:FHIPEP family type III secretion protein n=1 Tax=Paracoccus sp. S-4012 TaxID=2665648 RepID=UPI0012B1092F|nr:FHIPEP family type III secretion protein [Paracoccus sp. S-4012]MRX49700.1 flagellar type III secretion system protein FlhA [Paracoccus sp. S-4012]